jgi:hypothetical protein
MMDATLTLMPADLLLPPSKKAPGRRATKHVAA